jgi:hypothetical protein
VTGVADAAGRVQVVLPYPEPRWHGGSPPPGTVALADQTWRVSLAARYTPGPPAADPPDLCAVLAQVPATLLAGPASSVPLTAGALVFGRPIALRTAGLSVLLLVPA